MTEVYTVLEEKKPDCILLSPPMPFFPLVTSGFCENSHLIPISALLPSSHSDAKGIVGNLITMDEKFRVPPTCSSNKSEKWCSIINIIIS